MQGRKSGKKIEPAASLLQDPRSPAAMRQAAGTVLQVISPSVGLTWKTDLAIGAQRSDTHTGSHACVLIISSGKKVYSSKLWRRKNPILTETENPAAMKFVMGYAF